MSLALSESIRFTEKVQHYDINNETKIYTRIVTGPKPGKTAIYIHGGGSGGNHTMLLRPAKWLIEQGLFGKIILPDRRGEGYSTPLTKKLSIRDHAMDMKALLDKLNINEEITAIGLSYGGPIAIELADMDSRVNEIILMASSPSLRSVKGIRGFLYKSNLLEKLTRTFYKKNLGKLEPTYPNFEKVYDMKNNGELTKYFVEAIKHTDSKMLDSFIYQNASTLDQNNSAVSSEIKTDIPIFQIIGSKDEIWETDMSSYKNRFTNMKTSVIDGESHKGVILHAERFYNTLLKIYNINDKYIKTNP